MSTLPNLCVLWENSKAFETENHSLNSKQWRYVFSNIDTSPDKHEQILHGGGYLALSCVIFVKCSVALNNGALSITTVIPIFCAFVPIKSVFSTRNIVSILFRGPHLIQS